VTLMNAHHLIYRSAGGTDDLENLCSTCGVCHEKEHRHEIDIDAILTARLQRTTAAQSDTIH
jgi:5-methylcytosine-specific restriction endonuclease McrA